MIRAARLATILGVTKWTLIRWDRLQQAGKKPWNITRISGPNTETTSYAVDPHYVVEDLPQWVHHHVAELDYLLELFKQGKGA